MNRHTRNTALRALLWVVSAGCTWEPSARPVQPELLAEGSYEVLGMLDATRYAAAVRDPETAPRVNIFDLRLDESCEFPADTLPITGVISGPMGETEPAFLWPSAHFTADGARWLTFATPECKLRDVNINVSDNLYPISRDEDRRQVLLFGDGRGNLSIYDPWLDELTHIASGVGRFVQALRPQSGGNPVGPQTLILIENGALTVRALDGTLLLKRGENISELTQAAFSTLRIAYVDGGDLYEAVGPDFKPAPIQQDVCQVSYGGSTLSYYHPCADRQLVRLDLSTGERKEYDPGVYSQWEQGGFAFERSLDEMGQSLLFVTPPDGERVQVEPTLLANVQPLDNTRIVGQDAMSTFGIWSARDGFTPLLKKAGNVVGFIDTRTNRLSWVAMHDLDGGRGTLSYLEQPSFTLQTIATKVASQSVSVQQVFPIAEPILFYVRDATVSMSETTGSRYEGRLDARVLSGDLKSTIGAHVTSYTLVPDPNVTGLLYTTNGPKDAGLWFAAL